MSATMNPVAANLLARIERCEAKIGVIGLGYVGLPLAHALHQGGLPILGFDIDQGKIDAIKAGRNYLVHLGNAEAVAGPLIPVRFPVRRMKQESLRFHALLPVRPGLTGLAPHDAPARSAGNRVGGGAKPAVRGSCGRTASRNNRVPR